MSQSGNGRKEMAHPTRQFQGNLRKVLCTADIVLNGGKTGRSLHVLINKITMPTFPVLGNKVLERPVRAIHQESKVDGM